MDTNNFILEITKAVQQLLGSDYNVSSTTVTKNNNVSLTGIVIQRKGYNVSPTIYIDEFFDWYKEGASVDLIAEKVIRIYREHEVPFQFDISSVTDYEKAKSRIIFQLINTERNAALLETIPSFQFLDFSIIFKIFISSSPVGNSTITITNEMLNMWNISVDTVYKTAFENTPVLQEYTLKDIDTSIMEVIGIADIDKGNTAPNIMYVLTNKQCLCGCGCILYPHVLEDFAEQVKEDFYILPSSRHEVILLPEHGILPDYLKQIVEEVNRTAVSQEDFLSDNVYHYSKETREITIVQ